MKQNTYRSLMAHIPVPDGLNDRVLSAAREDAKQQGRKAALPRPWQILRVLVCTACALAVVVGGWYVLPRDSVPVQPGPSDNLPPHSFGLVAYAAEQEQVTPMENGKLAFFSSGGVAGPDIGCYTSFLFRVTGTNIQSVSATLDKGAFYQRILREMTTEEEVAEAFQEMDDGAILPAAISQRKDGTWSMDEVTPLGKRFTQAYDPEVSYGFWAPPEELPIAREDVFPRVQFEDGIHLFDGATMTLTVTFTDGSTQTKAYALHAGRLKIVYAEDGSQTVLPETASAEEPSVYGICAEELQ